MDHYHIYLLHIWTEHSDEEGHTVIVRGAVEEPHTGRRWAFNDVGDLTKCIEYMLVDVAEKKPEDSGE